MSASLQRHPLGITWTESGVMARSAHSLVDAGRVWLIDPFEDSEAIAVSTNLGQPAAVIQLLDRHGRDGSRIAERLGVPLLQMPSDVPSSPFTVINVISRRRWQEIALWWEARQTLVVAEAIGTGPLFSLGRRAGVHPLLRPFPPRALDGYGAQRLLVGHGPPVLDDAAGSVSEALQHSWRDIPKLLLKAPTALRKN